MAKKERIQLQRSDDFTEVDAELAQAIEALEQKSAQVSQLLEDYRPQAISLSGAELEGDDEPDAPPETSGGDTPTT